MKKSLLALAVLGAFAGAAQAQSSVTLYGIIDAGINYTSNVGGHSAWTATDGVMQSSRWGLKGAEDLGGGLKAVFQLENGFNLMNGKLNQGGREFGRQAWVGLSSATAGTFTIGRQYDSVVDYLGPLASGAQWAGYIGAHPADNDNLNNFFRTNNSVKYSSVNYNGFSFDTLYGFSNSTQFANNRLWSIGAGYANGPLTVGAAYLYGQNPGSATNGNGANTDGTFGDGARNKQIWGLGGAYAFGPATVGLVYTNVKVNGTGLINDNGNGATDTDVRVQNVELNGKYMLTPALQLGAAYTYTWAKDAAGLKPKYHQVNLGADYWLSKRTDAYVIGIYQKAAGDAQVADINALGASDTKHQVAVRVGLRHKF
ncbi:porin [Pandoraea sp.]|uniref:porin n=1 Tax=Pandoraea sp. TaxID=1883445 RepID=UPI00122B48FD|nr:porin [Pandoraea sp.]TAL56696.1 MAG: porin [Pandoraea sp.]TAM15517.1 MAG: porin [Pandoraea sp.]